MYTFPPLPDCQIDVQIFFAGFRAGTIRGKVGRSEFFAARAKYLAAGVVEGVLSLFFSVGRADNAKLTVFTIEHIYPVVFKDVF